jgi:hypothetical protein
MLCRSTSVLLLACVAAAVPAVAAPLVASSAGPPAVAEAAIAASPAAAHPSTAAAPATVGTDTSGAFLDAGAVILLERARTARQASDRTLRSYTALVRSRLGVAMRMPLKDRMLVREEAAARVRWSRDADDIVHMLAGRQQTPGGVKPALFGPGMRPMDPTADRLYFGAMFGDPDERDDDDYWIEHPLGDEGTRHYRYQSGDTLAIRLQDGREVRVIELRVLPRRQDPHTVRGVLWVDAASGALVQGAFRLARKVDIIHDMNAIDEEDLRIVERVPFITPMEFDISLLTVEYSLWEMRHWLPRAMRFEGMVRTGVLHFPASFDVSYRMEEVVTDGDAGDEPEADIVARTIEAWRGDEEASRVRHGREDARRYTRIAPRDQALLLESELLPPPIWADAPGFITESELNTIYDRLASVPLPARPGLPVRFGWGYGEPGMLRYNRVEALSVGGRVTAPLPHVTLLATARLGAGDLQPNGELLLHRETMRRTLSLRGYHELATADPSRRALGPGNSLSALLFGRDEGEYYRATGAELALAPPPLRRQWWQLRAYTERQDAVARNTHVALPRAWRDSVFRPNIVADEATQYGALLHVRPWWGTDPQRAQFGIDLLLQGEAGDFEHARGRLALRGAAPLGARMRVGAEAAVGTSEGTVPVQRHFYLGGASTLRGYEPSTVSGTSMARGRLELARTVRAASFAVFSDVGWAGDRDDIRLDRRRWSAGAGVSLLDGLVRFDLARGMDAPRGWRLDLHLDAVL